MFRHLALLLFVVVCNPAANQQVRVAAASDLSPCTADLKRTFEHENPDVSVTFSTGSSVQLAQQIESGAPFDVFLSADTDQPQRLLRSGNAEAGSLFVYANGELTLIVPRDSSIRSLQDLANPTVKHIAIANPDHAPYGKAAVQALTSARLYAALKPKLVTAENVAQAAQYVFTGNADAGLVSATAKTAAGNRVSAIPIDPSLYSPLRQAAVLTKVATQNNGAHRFLDFLRSPSAQVILRNHGLRAVVAGLQPADNTPQ